MASGMSAFSVSRIGLPLSHASASAMRLEVLLDAVGDLVQDAARSAADVLPHAGAAPCAASSALLDVGVGRSRDLAERLARHRRRVLEVLTPDRGDPLAADEVGVPRFVGHQGVRGTWAAVGGHSCPPRLDFDFTSSMRAARTNGAVDVGRSVAMSLGYWTSTSTEPAIRYGWPASRPDELLAQPRHLGTHGDHPGAVAVEVGGQLGRGPALAVTVASDQQDLGVPRRDVVPPAAELADHLQRRRRRCRAGRAVTRDTASSGVLRRPAGPASRPGSGSTSHMPSGGIQARPARSRSRQQNPIVQRQRVDRGHPSVRVDGERRARRSGPGWARPPSGAGSACGRAARADATRRAARPRRPARPSSDAPSRPGRTRRRRR